jgi:hypothetical protein
MSGKCTVNTNKRVTQFQIVKSILNQYKAKNTMLTNRYVPFNSE